MTTANKITIVRILLIPVFVTLAIYYGQSIQARRAGGMGALRRHHRLSYRGRQ